MKINLIQIASAKDIIGENMTGDEAMAVIQVEEKIIEKVIKQLEISNIKIAWNDSIRNKIAIVFNNNFGNVEIGQEITFFTKIITYINLEIIKI